MKRYFIVDEYFGIRVYDSKEKKEYYFTSQESTKIKNLLKHNYIEICNKRENQLGSPLKISMNLTKKCNLRCKQCFSNSGEIEGEELTTQDLFNLFDQMRQCGTFLICLGGGEPLTRPDLLDILAYGKKKQLAISVVSNGLLLDVPLIEKLNKMSLDVFWISFEGLQQNHDSLRGNGTFEKALNALSLLKKYYKRRTAIRMSLNKNNLGECKEILKIAEQYNVDIVRFTPLLEFGRAKNEDLTISQDQYIQFLKDIKKYKSKVKIIYPNMPNNEKFWIGTNGFGCHCGKEALWIDEVGTCNPCIFWGEEFNVGNIKTESLSTIWKKTLDISHIDGNNVCANCSNYNVCRGGCRARSLFLNNNVNDVDPLCPLKKNKN